MQKKSFFVYWAVGLLALFALVGVVGVANASLPTTNSSALQGLPAGPSANAPSADDGFDALPADQKGISYSTLVAMGKVHPVKVVPPAPDNWVNPYSPALNITWGPEKLTGAGSGEPAAGIHPTLFTNALVSGNVSIDNTINGGSTWQTRNPPNSAGYGDVVNGWLEDSPAHALEVALNPSGDGANMTCGQSTDFGVTWANFAGCGTSLSTTYFDDREYIWVDRNASSPFYGRTYVTEALFDSGGSGSFNTVTNRWSSDNGATWNPPSNAPIALVPNNEFALGLNHNEYPSLGISPNGTLGYVWHRGMCCGGPSPINSPNKVMFTRSTDGGVSFPYSTTIVTVPLNQSVAFNSTSPFGQRWSDTPNVAADPTTNGVFYALWTQYRTPGSAASAAIYLSGTTDNGVTWSTPVIPYNNPNANIFQGFGWVKVTADHTIHVTYLGGTSSNTQAGQFYVQSTDGGATWTAPFQLNSTAITNFASTTDYEADDVTLSAGPGAILATWDGNAGHYARIGLFTAGTATPTPTGTLPTSTPTNTPTNTPTATLTPCASGAIVNGGFETGSLAPWVVLGTQPPPTVSNAQPHSGTYSALLGTLSGGEPTGDSSIYQTITVPASGGTLSYWYNPSTADSITFDWQDAYITDTSGNILATIMHVCENTNTWTNVTFNMAPYAGQTVRIEFLVHQDGFGDDTSMYVDDALLLTACGSPVATDTPGPPTATPTCSAGTGAWAAGPDLPFPLVRSVGVYFPDGNFYSMGGRQSDAAGSDQLNPLEYNTTTNTWSVKSATYNDNQVNNQACGVLTMGGTPYIICVGGSAAGNTTASAQVRQYDPATDTLTPWATDNWPGNSTGGVLPGGFAVVNNKLYILGGFDINVSATNQIWELDPNAAAGSRWTQKTNAPGVLMYAPAAAIGGKIYIGGASDYQGGTVVDTNLSFSYDPATNTTATIATIPRATGETRGVVVNNHMWVLGGGRVAPNPSNEVDVYDPGTDTWSLGPAFVNPRRNFAADSDPGTGRVWLAGGYDSSGTNPLTSMEIFTPAAPCSSPTDTPVATDTPLVTNTPVATDTPVATNTPGGPTNTPTDTATGTPPTATETATACTLSFEDVPVGSTFYPYIECLACRGIINGYPCGGPGEPCNPTNDPYFRPGNNVTRGQFSKIASNSAGFNDPPDNVQQYQDVAVGSTFYDYIWRLTNRGLVNGYPCGGAGEPCGPGNLPYFRPNANVTRGQLSKIDANAAGLTQPPGAQQYEDVVPGSTFYDYIWRLTDLGVMNGYPCGGLGEPCGPGNLPYFRPGASATRGQASKIVANTFFPNCQFVQRPFDNAQVSH